jgi:hypothetical protein
VWQKKPLDFYNGKQSHIILFIMTAAKKSISKSFLLCEIQFREIYPTAVAAALPLSLLKHFSGERLQQRERQSKRYNIYFAFASSSSAREVFAAPSVAASQRCILLWCCAYLSRSS